MKHIVFIALLLPTIGKAQISQKDTSKCKHIYVATEPKEYKAKANWPSFRFAIPEPPIYGKHEDKEIVCVKCFHITKQIVDYGEAKGFLNNLPNVPDTLLIDGGALVVKLGGSGTLDTARKIIGCYMLQKHRPLSIAN